jgi:DNA ligase 1
MFKPTLACDADLDRLRFPLYASPKLDGIRCSIVNGRALTRTLKEVPNRAVYNALSQEGLSGLDGELIVGAPNSHDVYRNTVSGIMSRDGEPEYTYHVFDVHNADGGWRSRYDMLYDAIDGTGRIQILTHTLIYDHDELMEYEQLMVGEGFEGVILRHPNAPYKFGRSTAREGYLLKLKRFKDSEAYVMDIIEEMHNGNEAQTNELGRTKRSSHKENKTGKGRMGALLVRDKKTNVEFQIGTGFTDADKEWWWNEHLDRQRTGGWKSKVVKYKYFPVGVKDLPRHPVYLGLRDPGDM